MSWYKWKYNIKWMKYIHCWGNQRAHRFQPHYFDFDEYLLWSYLEGISAIVYRSHIAECCDMRWFILRSIYLLKIDSFFRHLGYKHWVVGNQPNTKTYMSVNFYDQYIIKHKRKILYTTCPFYSWRLWNIAELFFIKNVFSKRPV